MFRVVELKLCSIGITALGEQPDIVEDMSALKNSLISLKGSAFRALWLLSTLNTGCRIHRLRYSEC